MSSELHQFNNTLDAYLRTQFNYKNRVSEVGGFGVSIDTPRKKRVELYLRYKPTYEPYLPNTLVIARIGFQETRKGHGTSLLRFIAAVADQFGIDHIALEQVSENSKAFCKALGFNEIAKNVWSVPITNLAQ
jgi:predicted GNAT superfamily acetyltransferase